MNPSPQQQTITNLYRVVLRGAEDDDSSTMMMTNLSTMKMTAWIMFKPFLFSRLYRLMRAPPSLL